MSVTQTICIPIEKLKEWLRHLEDALSQNECPLPSVLEVSGDIDSLLCRECQVLATIGKKCDLHE